MKILFMLGSLDSGGAQRVAVNLCNSFVEKNNDVLIMITKMKSNSYKINNKINIVKLDDGKFSKLIRSFSILRKMKNEIINYAPDVIISFLPEPTARVLFLKKVCKRISEIPVILSVRADPNVIYRSFKRKITMKWLYGISDGYIFQTEEAKRFFSKKIQEKSKIILNPINKDFFIEEFKGEREKTFVTVGRLTKQKNHELLINAFNILHEKYPEFKLYIYGEGELEEDLKDRIKELSLDKNVFLKGTSKRIQDEINNKYSFVLSSDFEGLPNALMEAMALGLPCISTNCTGGGATTLIKDGYNGLIVPVNDTVKLANAMIKLANDYKYAKQLGNEAIKIRDKCSEEIIVSEWLEYINNIIRERN